MRAFMLAGLLAAIVTFPAMADDAEETYSSYHQSIEAAKLCRNMEFTQVQIDAMASVIHGKLEGDIGAKRLSLLTQAQRDAKELVETRGCDSGEVQILLGLFDSDLAPVL